MANESILSKLAHAQIPWTLLLSIFSYIEDEISPTHSISDHLPLSLLLELADVTTKNGLSNEFKETRGFHDLMCSFLIKKASNGVLSLDAYLDALYSAMVLSLNEKLIASMMNLHIKELGIVGILLATSYEFKSQNYHKSFVLPRPFTDQFRSLVAFIVDNDVDVLKWCEKLLVELVFQDQIPISFSFMKSIFQLCSNVVTVNNSSKFESILQQSVANLPSVSTGNSIYCQFLIPRVFVSNLNASSQLMYGNLSLCIVHSFTQAVYGFMNILRINGLPESVEFNGKLLKSLDQFEIPKKILESLADSKKSDRISNSSLSAIFKLCNQVWFSTSSNPSSKTSFSSLILLSLLTLDILVRENMEYISLTGSEEKLCKGLSQFADSLNLPSNFTEYLQKKETKLDELTLVTTLDELEDIKLESPVVRHFSTPPSLDTSPKEAFSLLLASHGNESLHTMHEWSLFLAEVISEVPGQGADTEMEKNIKMIEPDIIATTPEQTLPPVEVIQPHVVSAPQMIHVWLLSNATLSDISLFHENHSKEIREIKDALTAFANADPIFDVIVAETKVSKNKLQDVIDELNYDYFFPEQKNSFFLRAHNDSQCQPLVSSPFRNISLKKLVPELLAKVLGYYKTLSNLVKVSYSWDSSFMEFFKQIDACEKVSISKLEITPEIVIMSNAGKLGIGPSSRKKKVEGGKKILHSNASTIIADAEFLLSELLICENKCRLLDSRIDYFTNSEQTFRDNVKDSTSKSKQTIAKSVPKFIRPDGTFVPADEQPPMQDELQLLDGVNLNGSGGYPTHGQIIHFASTLQVSIFQTNSETMSSILKLASMHSLRAFLLSSKRADYTSNILETFIHRVFIPQTMKISASSRINVASDFSLPFEDSTGKVHLLEEVIDLDETAISTTDSQVLSLDGSRSIVSLWEGDAASKHQVDKLKALVSSDGDLSQKFESLDDYLFLRSMLCASSSISNLSSALIVADGIKIPDSSENGTWSTRLVLSMHGSIVPSPFEYSKEVLLSEKDHLNHSSVENGVTTLSTHGLRIASTLFSMFDVDGDGLLLSTELLLFWDFCFPFHQGAQEDLEPSIRVAMISNWFASHFSCSAFVSSIDIDKIALKSVQGEKDEERINTISVWTSHAPLSDQPLHVNHKWVPSQRFSCKIFSNVSAGDIGGENAGLKMMRLKHPYSLFQQVRTIPYSSLPGDPVAPASINKSSYVSKFGHQTSGRKVAQSTTRPGSKYTSASIGVSAVTITEFIYWLLISQPNRLLDILTRSDMLTKVEVLASRRLSSSSIDTQNTTGTMVVHDDVPESEDDEDSDEDPSNGADPANAKSENKSTSQQVVSALRLPPQTILSRTSDARIGIVDTSSDSNISEDDASISDPDDVTVVSNRLPVHSQIPNHSRLSRTISASWSISKTSDGASSENGVIEQVPAQKGNNPRSKGHFISLSNAIVNPEEKKRFNLRQKSFKLDRSISLRDPDEVSSISTENSEKNSHRSLNRSASLAQGLLSPATRSRAPFVVSPTGVSRALLHHVPSTKSLLQAVEKEKTLSEITLEIIAKFNSSFTPSTHFGNLLSIDASNSQSQKRNVLKNSTVAELCSAALKSIKESSELPRMSLDSISTSVDFAESTINDDMIFDDDVLDEELTNSSSKLSESPIHTTGSISVFGVPTAIKVAVSGITQYVGKACNWTPEATAALEYASTQRYLHSRQAKRVESRVSPDQRLFDYLICVGRGDPFDWDEGDLQDPSSLEYSGNVDQRFPETDWPHSPLPGNLAPFVFPNGIRLSSLPQPSSYFTFVLTFEDSTRMYCSALVVYEPVDIADIVSDFIVNDPEKNSENYYDGPSWCHPEVVSKPSFPYKVVYCPKAFVLLSHHAIFSAMKHTLIQLVRIASSNNLPVKMFDIVRHVMMEVPLPPRGLASIGYTLCDRHIIIARPPANDFPLLDIDLSLVIRCLSMNNLLSIYVALFCERRMVICSQYIHLLTPICEVLCALLFPFRWVVNYIPILPASMIEIIGAPTPYLIGWNGSISEARLYSSDTVFVDVDNDRVFVPPFSPLPKLPEAQRKKLAFSLQKYAYGPCLGANTTNPTVGTSLNNSSNTSRVLNFLGRNSLNGPKDIIPGAESNFDFSSILKQKSIPLMGRSTSISMSQNPGRLNRNLTNSSAFKNGIDSVPDLLENPSIMIEQNIAPVDRSSMTSLMDKILLPVTEPLSTLSELTLSAPWTSTFPKYHGLVDIVNPDNSVIFNILPHLASGWKWSASDEKVIRDAVSDGEKDEIVRGTSMASSTASFLARAPFPSLEASKSSLGRPGSQNMQKFATAPVSTTKGLSLVEQFGSLSSTSSGDSLNKQNLVGETALHLSSGSFSESVDELMSPISGTNIPFIIFTDDDISHEGLNAADLIGSEFNPTEIRHAFMRFMVSLFKGYSKCISYEQIGVQGEKMSRILISRIVSRFDFSNESRDEVLNARTAVLNLISNNEEWNIPRLIAPLKILREAGVPVPVSLPIPMLSPIFDRETFISQQSSSTRELVRAIIETQSFSAFTQDLVPTLYKPADLNAMSRKGSSEKVPWSVSQDPLFESRLPSTIRLFNASINVKLNRLNESKLSYGFRSKPTKLDTSFLSDRSFDIVRHFSVSVPTPSPQFISLDTIVSLAMDPNKDSLNQLSPSPHVLTKVASKTSLDRSLSIGDQEASSLRSLSFTLDRKLKRSVSSISSKDLDLGVVDSPRSGIHSISKSKQKQVRTKSSNKARYGENITIPSVFLLAQKKLQDAPADDPLKHRVSNTSDGHSSQASSRRSSVVASGSIISAQLASGVLRQPERLPIHPRTTQDKILTSKVLQPLVGHVLSRSRSGMNQMGIQGIGFDVKKQQERIKRNTVAISAGIGPKKMDKGTLK
jgi:DENN (AEX-3) domain/uDENN domain